MTRGPLHVLRDIRACRDVLIDAGLQGVRCDGVPQEIVQLHDELMPPDLNCAYVRVTSIRRIARPSDRPWISGRGGFGSGVNTNGWTWLQLTSLVVSTAEPDTQWHDTGYYLERRATVWAWRDPRVSGAPIFGQRVDRLVVDDPHDATPRSPQTIADVWRRYAQHIPSLAPERVVRWSSRVPNLQMVPRPAPQRVVIRPANLGRRRSQARKRRRGF